MELRADGNFRFRTVLLLVARQNGKTTLIEVKNLWKMFVLRVPLVIGTAQSLDISEESWDKAVEVVDSIPELAAEVEHVDRTNGKKALRLAHGSRWKIAAASRRGGRGLAGDDVNLDELREHQSWESWAAVTKTTMARPNAQIYAFSNAGDDKSIVLNDLHAKARAATEQLDDLLAGLGPAESALTLIANQSIDTTLGLFEWSADESIKCTCGRAEGQGHAADCRLQDRRAWAAANPSLGYTVTEAALASALGTDPGAVFRTECLCQRVPTLAGEWLVISEAEWRALVGDRETRPAEVAFAVQVSYDRTSAVIWAAGEVDGKVLLSMVDCRPGTHWVVARVRALKAEWDPAVIAIQDKGPTGSLLEDMEREGLHPPEHRDEPRRGDLVIPWANDVADAYGLFIDAVRQDRLRHLDEAVLNRALAVAETRPLGNATAWEYRHDEVAALLAATLALWAWLTYADKVRRQYDALANIG